MDGMSLTYGAGCNPAYLHSAAALRLPSSVRHVEVGLREYEIWCRNAPSEVELSLHLARTPVTEEARAQDTFIVYLCRVLNAVQDATGRKPVSIGLHLTGPRDSGMGWLGFSSHYLPSPQAESRAARFIERLRQAAESEVWIENANFYTDSASASLGAWESTTRICDRTGAGIIVDLSHLTVDAHNNGLSPYALLGAVPWRHTVELHLSGIIEGKDGAFHDGHSKPIYPFVWALLNQCLQGLLPADRRVALTIEHTDPCWVTQRAAHDSDFAALSDAVEIVRAIPHAAARADQYARGYLRRLLKQWLPRAVTVCEAREVSFDTVVDEWLSEVRHSGRRIVLTEEEVPPEERDAVCIATKDFAVHLRRRFAQC